MIEHVEEFTLESTSAGQLGLKGALEGKRAAVVVFWSGVCSHCQRYDDYLGEFAGRHPEVALLVVACREEEDREAVERIVAERDLRFPVLLDTEREVAHRWQVHQTPRVFLVTPELEAVYRGAIDNFTYPEDPKHLAYLETALEEYLAGQPLSRAETASFGCPTESVYYQLPKPFSG